MGLKLVDQFRHLEKVHLKSEKCWPLGVDQEDLFFIYGSRSIPAERMFLTICCGDSSKAR